MTAWSGLRLVGLTWWLQVKMLNRSAYDSVVQVVWPLFFATAALMIYRVTGDQRSLLFAALGASVMTIWTAISSTASGILLRERGFGTLELLVAAPAPTWLPILAMVAAVTTIGLYGMVATLVWAAVVFGVAVSVANWPVFLAAVLVTTGSYTVLGMLLSAATIRYRAAWALGGALEYPVWLIGGFLVPTQLLPGWVHPVSWLLPPSWGMAAIRAAAAGDPAMSPLLLCLGSAVGYAVLAGWVFQVTLRSARRSATLGLT